MGGHSRWNVLDDEALSSRMSGYFRKPPAVLSGVLSQEAERVWREWNPLVWAVIKKRGVFVVPTGRCSPQPGIEAPLQQVTATTYPTPS